MFVCPNCMERLARNEWDGGVFWVCPACGGRTATVAELRRAIAPDAFNHLWQLAREGKGERKRLCPACERPMLTVAATDSPEPLHLEVCTRDYVVWFDPQEYEALPPAPPGAAAESELPLEARLLLAKYEVEELDTRAELELGSAPPEEGWKALPALFGMPVEQESRPLAHLPLATWAIGASVFLLSFLAFLVHLEAVVNDFGLIPAQVGRYGGLTLLSSFFLHGGAAHLLGNLYFLLVFGDDVEDYVGQNRYLLLLLAATVAGGVSHVLARPDDTTALIGASGGISGLLAFYGLQFPRARIGFLVRFPWMSFRWIHLRAWVYVLLWVTLQSIGALQQISGVTQVSFLAHLGGASAGFVFWLLWRANRR